MLRDGERQAMRDARTRMRTPQRTKRTRNARATMPPDPVFSLLLLLIFFFFLLLHISAIRFHFAIIFDDRPLRGIFRYFQPFRGPFSHCRFQIVFFIAAIFILLRRSSLAYFHVFYASICA
jgi:hypothetical protein